MNALYAAAVELQRFIRRKRWRFCIIGGLAVIRWGEPRATKDVDLSLLVRFGKEERYVDALLNAFRPRIPNARAFALENRVLLCKGSNGIPLDVALAGFPFEEQMIRRASRFRYAPGVMLTTASAEDLVVLKAFADRDQDWVDIRGILVRHKKRLDWDLIWRELYALCELKEDSHAIERLQELRHRAESDRS